MIQSQSLFLVHTAATLMMTGLIWFVQIVHYPLFNRVGADQSARYERAHQIRTSIVVMPLMLIELLSGLWLVVRPPEISWLGWLITNLLLLAAVWGSTFVLQVPQHKKLERGFDALVHRRLVMTNWLRTGLWTARSALIMGLLYKSL